MNVMSIPHATIRLEIMTVSVTQDFCGDGFICSSKLIELYLRI